jgi:hypothetical protein
VIKLNTKKGHRVRISHVNQEGCSRQLDLYIFVPRELGLNAHILDEDTFYYKAIQSKRTYYSEHYHLPLVHSRLASRSKLPSEQYRLSLSLYAYQYVQALEEAIQDLLENNKEQKISPDTIEEVNELSLQILKRLRRNIPLDPKQVKYYHNIDNYLSWHSEQSWLNLLANLPSDSDYAQIKALLLEISQNEAEYRLKKNYNSTKTMQDPTRMSNKMRLLRHLLEYPVTLNEKGNELGRDTQKIVTGASAGIVMIFVTILLTLARTFWEDITLSFLGALSFIYALREVFKDDLKKTLLRLLRKGKPKWRKQFFDPSLKKLVGHQLVWVEYSTYDSLSPDIKQMRKNKVSQREESILHYKSVTLMSPTKFLSGYEQTRELIELDLGILTGLMEKEAQHIFQVQNNKVSKELVEKRHLINLITKETDADNMVCLQRWKVVMSRSKITDIEAVEPPLINGRYEAKVDPALNGMRSPSKISSLAATE